MSSSVAIPVRAPAGTAGSYSASSSYSSNSSTPPSSKGKNPVSASPPERISPRRPSLLGSSLSKAEHTVINLGHGDGPPRLVTCVKSSQGFDWNQELFLPSYADFDAQELEHRPDNVAEIVLTDEEAAAILPQ